MRRNIRMLILTGLLTVSVAVNGVTSLARELSLSSTTAIRNTIANNWEYYARGYRDYNCLAYALGYTDQWMWPWGDRNPTESEVKSYLRSYGYSITTNKSSFTELSAKKKIIVYSVNGNGITHFSKKYGSEGIVAKWGQYEIFTGNKYASYTNNLYGQPSFYAYRYK